VDTADGRNCTFRKPFPYLLAIEEQIFKAVIPVGTVVDGASIPRVFWAVFQPFGRHWRAAVIHDAAYGYGGLWREDGAFLPITKADADDLFRQGMQLLGVEDFQTESEFEAVESFGKHVWNEYRSKDPEDKSKPENWSQ
jgi:hypothetical protein